VQRQGSLHRRPFAVWPPNRENSRHEKIEDAPNPLHAAKKSSGPPGDRTDRLVSCKGVCSNSDRSEFGQFTLLSSPAYLQAGSQQAGSQQAGSQQAGSQQAGLQQQDSFARNRANRPQRGGQQHGSQQAGSQQAGSQAAGSQVAGSQVAGSHVAGGQQVLGQQVRGRHLNRPRHVRGRQVCGQQVAGSQVAGSQVAGAHVAGGQQVRGAQVRGRHLNRPKHVRGRQVRAQQVAGSQVAGSQQAGSQQAGSQQAGSQHAGSQQPLAKRPAWALETPSATASAIAANPVNRIRRFMGGTPCQEKTWWETRTNLAQAGVESNLGVAIVGKASVSLLDGLNSPCPADSAAVCSAEAGHSEADSR